MLLLYYNHLGIVIPYHQAFAQNPNTEIDLIGLLLKDTIQALDKNDVNAAFEHLKLVDQQLAISGKSDTILRSMLLTEALQTASITEWRYYYSPISSSCC